MRSRFNFMPVRCEMAAEQIGTGHPDGSVLGIAGGKISFLGGAAAAQPAVTYSATITATYVTISDGQQGFGFATSDQIISVIGVIKDIQHVLTTFNLWG